MPLVPKLVVVVSCSPYTQYGVIDAQVSCSLLVRRQVRSLGRQKTSSITKNAQRKKTKEINRKM